MKTDRKRVKNCETIKQNVNLINLFKSHVSSQF